MASLTDLPRPFFTAPGDSDGAGTDRRRLLLITYSFPPDQAIGALRWQKLARFVAERGWGLDVIMLEPAELESRDETRLAELPPGTRVFGVPHVEIPLVRLQRMLRAVYRRVWPRPQQAGVGTTVHRDEFARSARGLGGILPAFRVWARYASFLRWARDAADVATGVFVPGVHEAVVTSGPPHQAHEAGVLVAGRTGLPLVIDLRDPWSLFHRFEADFASPLALKLARKYEARAVRAARLVVLNTEPLLRAMRQAYPEAAPRMIAVLNGADEETLPPPSFGHRFTLAFAGTIYVDRDPRPLLRAARRVIDELGLTPADIGIDFIGHVEGYGGVPIPEMAREEGVGDFVTVGGPRPRREALEFLAGAQLLVSLPQDGTMQVPAKIYEYLNFPAWLLIFGEPGSAPDLLLRGVPGANVLPLGDEAAAAAAIRERYLQYRRGERPRPVNAGGRFSRRNQAMRLLDAIEQCVDSPAGDARSESPEVGATFSPPPAPAPRSPVPASTPR